MADRVRVFVADDARLFRDLLEWELAPRYELLEGASSLDAIDAAFARGPIDVALIDLAWKDEGSCLPRMKHWKSLQPSCRVVIVTGYTDWVLCESCLALGAAGFASKADSMANIERAIEMAHGGEQYISAKVIREPACAITSARGTLSRSARRVLGLLAEGFTQKQIANTLALGVRTVEDHVRAIKRHFGIDSRAKPNWRVYAAGIHDGGRVDVV